MTHCNLDVRRKLQGASMAGGTRGRSCRPPISGASCHLTDVVSRRLTFESRRLQCHSSGGLQKARVCRPEQKQNKCLHVGEHTQAHTNAAVFVSFGFIATCEAHKKHLGLHLLFFFKGSFKQEDFVLPDLKLGYETDWRLIAKCFRLIGFF